MTQNNISISHIITTPHNENLLNQLIAIQGWVRGFRGSKKVGFLSVSDGSCAHRLQVVLSDALWETHKDTLRLGVSVQIQGILVASQGSGQSCELQGTKIHIYGECPVETYPLQKKGTSLEFLREIAHIRPQTATFGAVFRIRHWVSKAIHDFFHNEGFFYVHTPLLTTTDGEGAGEAFQVTTQPLHEWQTTPNKVDYSQELFKQAAWLCVTGQLHGEAVAMGLGKIYTFGPTFRAENSNTSRHLAEFWMIEPEWAFADLEAVMALAERLLKYIVQTVLEKCGADLAVLSGNPEIGIDTKPMLEQFLQSQVCYMSYTEAMDILQRADTPFTTTVVWGDDLKTEHERYLCEVHTKKPTIIYNYPSSLKAFYMYENGVEDGINSVDKGTGNRNTVRAMDFLVPGIGEIMGGSQREDRVEVLEAKIRDKGIDPSSLEWYADLRRFGSTPHSGFGLGFERVLMWVTGISNIRDVIPFPRTAGHWPY
jgi:asparaginyl-tRNA synthetase